MVNKLETLNNLRRAMEMYQELGFEYLAIESAALAPFMEGIVREEPVIYAKTEDTRTDVRRGTGTLKSLREKIGDCRLCGLSEGRKNIVFGEGNPGAEILFIGEGPGREEDVQGRPFVGAAGSILNSLIDRMGFTRKDVYIANIVKCRPPKNRDPEDDEINVCLPFLKRQIEIISPKVIMSLGRVASQALLGSKTPISRLRGQFFLYNDIPVMPTFHPAYLMRNPKAKWSTWEDAQMVLKKLATN